MDAKFSRRQFFQICATGMGGSSAGGIGFRALRCPGGSPRVQAAAHHRLLLATGIVIWRPYFAPAFNVAVVRVAVLLHAAAAFVLILGIIVHIYAAIWVKGTIRAMTRGDVTWAWARKHHPAWFRQVTGQRR